MDRLRHLNPEMRDHSTRNPTKTRKMQFSPGPAIRARKNYTVRELTNCVELLLEDRDGPGALKLWKIEWNDIMQQHQQARRRHRLHRRKHPRVDIGMANVEIAETRPTPGFQVLREHFDATM